MKLKLRLQQIDVAFSSRKQRRNSTANIIANPGGTGCKGVDKITKTSITSSNTKKKENGVPEGFQESGGELTWGFTIKKFIPKFEVEFPVALRWMTGSYTQVTEGGEDVETPASQKDSSTRDPFLQKFIAENTEDRETVDSNTSMRKRLLMWVAMNELMK